MSLLNKFVRVLAAIAGLVVFFSMPILTGYALKWLVDMRSYTYINGMKVYVASDRFELFLMVIYLWVFIVVLVLLMSVSIYFYKKTKAVRRDPTYSAVLVILALITAGVLLFLAVTAILLLNSMQLIEVVIMYGGCLMSTLGCLGVYYAIKDIRVSGRQA
jgi:hypothetical protein